MWKERIYRDANVLWDHHVINANYFEDNYLILAWRKTFIALCWRQKLFFRTSLWIRIKIFSNKRMSLRWVVADVMHTKSILSPKLIYFSVCSKPLSWKTAAVHQHVIAAETRVLPQVGNGTLTGLKQPAGVGHSAHQAGVFPLLSTRLSSQLLFETACLSCCTFPCEITCSLI